MHDKKSLEYWLICSLYDHEGITPEYLKHEFKSDRFSQIVELYNDIRSKIEDVLKNHDENLQSWQVFRSNVWVLHIPFDLQVRTISLMQKWAKEDGRRK